MQLICTLNPTSFSGLRAFVASSKNYLTASDEHREGLGTRLSTHHVARLEDGEQFCDAERYLIKFMRSLVIFIFIFLPAYGVMFLTGVK